MLKDEKAKPDYYVYNLLIGTCGKVGYVQKAFHLFNQVCNLCIFFILNQI